MFKIKRNERLSHIPILVISARTAEEDKLKVLDMGVNNFMNKWLLKFDENFNQVDHIVAEPGNPNSLANRRVKAPDLS